MNLHSRIQCRVVFGSLLHTLSFSVLPESFPLPHLCHTSSIPLLLLQTLPGCFPPPLPMLSRSCPASLGCQLGRREGFPWIWAPYVAMCSCCDALADGEQGIPSYFAFLFQYPVGMSYSLCLCLTLVEMRDTPEFWRRGRTVGCHNHLTPVAQGMKIMGFVQLHFQNFHGNSGRNERLKRMIVL